MAEQAISNSARSGLCCSTGRSGGADKQWQLSGDRQVDDRADAVLDLRELSCSNGREFFRDSAVVLLHQVEALLLELEVPVRQFGRLGLLELPGLLRGREATDQVDALVAQLEEFRFIVLIDRPEDLGLVAAEL